MKPLTLLLLFLPALALAAIEVEVTWQDPDSYRDIQPAGESRERFRKRLFRNLEEHLEKLASSLEGDGRLEIVVTDMTLAGRVETGRHGETRVVTDARPARIVFEYRLLDAAGQIVKEGNERLMGTITSVRTRGFARNDPFVVEKSLLSRWFERTF